jgi:hypothetical protein
MASVAFVTTEHDEATQTGSPNISRVTMSGNGCVLSASEWATRLECKIAASIDS